jgi:methionyl-tRNA formyltransferase
VPSLRRLVEAGHEVVLVVTQPDRPAGRGRQLTAPPVKLEAERLGLDVAQAPDAARLRAAGADVGVVAAYGEILTREVLGGAARGFVNVHPSLLPRLRGATPIPTAILEGLDSTGVTVMQVTPGVDAGPILAQVGEPIRGEDTAASLGVRLAELGADLLVETLSRLATGAIEPRRQDGRAATYSRQLRREDGRIDWSQSAVELWRRARAFQPWPGFHTTWDGRLIKLLEVEPLPSREGHPPGRVFAHRRGLAVASGTGALLLRRVQPEGRSAMAAEELARGQSTFREATLGG